jgi:aquaporin Z
VRDAVNEQSTACLVELVFHRIAADGNFDEHIDTLRRTVAGGNQVDVHGSGALVRATAMASRLRVLTMVHASPARNIRAFQQDNGRVTAARWLILGTFWLVLGGCGSAVLAAAFPDVGIGLLGSRSPSA